MTSDRENMNLYECFHTSSKVQRKIVGKNNYTYFNIIKSLEPILKRKKKLNVLDYGCGVGTLSLYIANNGHSVVGIDISEKAINTAVMSSKYLGLDKKTKFFKLSESKKYINKSRFDLILLTEVIEHIPQDKVILKFLASLLKNGGYIFLSTPSSSAPLYKWGLLTDFDRRVGHLRRYDKNTLIKLLNSIKMNVVEISDKDSIFRNFLYTFPKAGVLIRGIKGVISDIMMTIETPLIKIFGGASYYVIAKKE